MNLKKNYENQNRWFKLNDLDTNQEYAEKILKKFNLSKYHFIYDKYGILSLLIENNLKKYKVIVNTSELNFEIYRCEVHNFSKYTKENMVLKKKIDNDCIYNSIKWIAKNSKGI